MIDGVQLCTILYKLSSFLYEFTELDKISPTLKWGLEIDHNGSFGDKSYSQKYEHSKTERYTFQVKLRKKKSKIEMVFHFEIIAEDSTQKREQCI